MWIVWEKRKKDAFMSKNSSNKQDNVWYYWGTVTAHVLYTGDTENMAMQEKMYEGS